MLLPKLLYTWACGCGAEGWGMEFRMTGLAEETAGTGLEMNATEGWLMEASFVLEDGESPTKLKRLNVDFPADRKANGNCPSDPKAEWCAN